MQSWQSPGNANEEVTLLRRPTARGSSSTERMCRALGLCIHMVPVQEDTQSLTQTVYRLPAQQPWWLSSYEGTLVDQVLDVNEL